MMKFKVGNLEYFAVRAEHTYHRNEITTVSDGYESIVLSLITEDISVRNLINEIAKNFNGTFSVELEDGTEETFEGYKLLIGRKQLNSSEMVVEFSKGSFELDKEAE